MKMEITDEDYAAAADEGIAGMPTAQSEPSEVANAVREAATKNKRKREAEAAAMFAAATGDAGTAAAAAAAAAAGGSAPPPTSQRTSCVHEVAIPTDWEGDLDALNNPVYAGTRAKEYPFVLDAFQETSVAVLERGESVMARDPLLTHFLFCSSTTSAYQLEHVRASLSHGVGYLQQWAEERTA